MNNNNLYGQETDLALVLQLIKIVNSDFFIDIGAEKGGFAAALLDAGMQGVCFEPLPSHLVKLRERFVGCKVQIFPLAVDREDREAAFHIATNPDGEELDYYHSLNIVKEHDFFSHSKEIVVQCRSLDSLVRSGELPSTCSVLKIDTEGNDLRVLEGMGEFRPEIIVCEFVPPSVYPDWQLAFAERLIPAAAECGYENFLAVRRTHGTPGERLELNPGDLGPDDWGNLIFLRTDLLARAGDLIQGMLEEHTSSAALQNVSAIEGETTDCLSETKPPDIRTDTPPTLPLAWWKRFLGLK